MGSWNEVDGLTSLPILDEMPCRAMFIQKAPKRPSAFTFTYPFDHFIPVSALVKGKYNDYGWMDFDSGEEQRLFDTAASIGIEARKEKEESVKLPEDTYFWMIREDTFQMLDTLPIEHFTEVPKTVGEDIAWRIEKFEDLALQTVGLDPLQNWGFRDRLNQLFHGSHMPKMAIKKALFEKDRRPDAVFDYVKLFSAMLALHKCLMPTHGGSQTFVTETYQTYAAFIIGACDQYIKECEEM
jgi:hypothetical protein